jgi:tRNA threonylcarbamoyladenosine biosynthesis protein TsaB
MKTLLCLESSAEPTVIGVVQEGMLLSECVFANRDEFAQSAAQALRDANRSPRDFQGIAIGIGPGSFTGLRVSLAFAKGMARGLAVPIWPMSSFQIIAANVRSEVERIGVITHARRGQVHFALCHGTTLEFIERPQVILHEELLRFKDRMALLIGPGVKHLSPELREHLASWIPEDADVHRPHTMRVAQLARAEWLGKERPDAASLEPEYGLEFRA